MEARLHNEGYFIGGEDRSDLIPKDATYVSIAYLKHGTVKNVHFTKELEERRRETAYKRCKRFIKETKRLNARELSQEEMEEIAGLVKKATSKD